MKRAGIALSLLTAMVLVACSPGSSGSEEASPAQASAPAASSQPSADAVAESTAASSAPTASAAPEALEPIDRLLPTEVIETYAPSFPIDNQFDDAKDASEFAPLEKVRPRTCTPLLQFLTSPLDDSDGQLAGYATNYVFTEYPGPSFEESLFAYPTEAEAAAAFEAAVGLVPDCRNSAGQWPQQGTLIIDDGINRERLEVGKVTRLSTTAVILQSKPGYDGEISDLSALVLAGDAVLWLETRTYEENSNAKRLARFTTFVEQAQEFALTGELPDQATVDAAEQLTLDCLELKPLPYELWRNYDEFYGRGRGNDLFVENRIAVTNNCGKTVRGFKYDAEFTDELDELLLSGTGSERLIVKPGQTRRTAPDRGWTIRAVFDSDVIKTFLRADPADITVVMTPTKVLFADKTSLP